MSDGAAWGDADARVTDPRNLAALTAQAAEKRRALVSTVRGSAVLMAVLRVLLVVARPLAATLPHGATITDLVGVGLEVVERET